MEKEKITKELGLSKNPCVKWNKPVTTKELHKVMEDPEFEKRIK